MAKSDVTPRSLTGGGGAVGSRPAARAVSGRLPCRQPQLEVEGGRTEHEAMRRAAELAPPMAAGVSV